MAMSDDKTSSFSPWKHHVFLSFRGEDTRQGFTDHLRYALQQRGIITFIDDQQIRIGQVISEELLLAIEESLAAIVILSRNYASSSWCLDELLKILECRKSMGREVIPVFYNVDPSDVRHQRGTFEDAFCKHDNEVVQDKVQRWKDGLKHVSNLAGFDSRNRHESKLIEEIVADVWTKLQPKLTSFKIELVGIESKIEEVNSMLSMGLSDVRLLGIWGMGGIGKTSLARALYERICDQFDICCFLGDVRDVSEKKGIVHLQRKFLSHLKLRNIKFNDTYEGKKMIRSLLCNKKVLIVLDDVSDTNHFEYLAIKKTWLGLGSRIIVTTRYKHLLEEHGEFEKYEAKLMNNEESLQLFCQKAFKGEKPKGDYLELTKNVIEHAAGLPLTLEVLGCHLCGRNVLEWKNAVEKIKKVPPRDIIKRLRISYEALDDMEKKIFLDIACFFKGMAKDQVMQILEICGLYSTIGIKELTEKCLLIEYYDHGKWRLGMHDILQEMGKNIVIQESPNDAGRRSRLWSQEDIDHVLTKNSGSKLIEVILLQSSKPYKACWDFEAFSAMLNLRILIISCDVYLPFGLRCLPNSLKILEWWRYPLKSLPLDVRLNELVDLKMHYSNIRQLWNGTQIMLQKLRFIDLSHSKDLIRSPDFSMLPNLEELVLEGCTELVEVHPSMGQHKKLVTMNLRNCKNLKVLPHRLEMDSLEKLLLTGCSKVKRLPVFGENMKCLSVLDLKGCTNLACLPSSMGNLKSLRILIICGCSKIFSMPEDLDKNEFLEEIDVSGTAIRELPSNIFNLRNLKVLNLNRCTTLRSPSKSYWNLLTSLRKALAFGSHGVPRTQTLNLPPSVSSLSSLNILKLSNCNLSARSIPDDLGCLASLQVLDLSGNNFSNIPAGSWVLPPSFSTLYSLRTLSLADCNLQDGSLPQDFSCLSKLEYLRLSGNNFTILPASCVSNLLHLRTLGLKRCPRLQKLPDLPPNVKFINSFTKICDSMESLSFPEELWKLIASPDFQVHFPHSLSHKGLFVFWNIIGSEIPSWFNNKSFHYRENVVGFRNGNIIQTPTREIMCQSFMDNENHRVKIVDSIVSMKVDVSHYCGSSENWGISVCLVVQDMEPSNSKWVKPFIWLSSKSCKDEFFEYESGWEVSSLCKGPQLFIMFLPSTYITVGSEHIELILFSSKFCVEEEANQLESNCESPAGKFIIIDCGWRVTSKEELEEWKKTSMSECNTSNLIEMHSESSVSKLWVTEAANGKRGRDESAKTKPYISQRRRLI